MATQPVRIRSLKEIDIDQLVDLEYKCFGGSHEQLSHGARYMIAEIDDQPVGFLSYALLERSVWLDCVAVDPAHRRTGIGARMVERLGAHLGAYLGVGRRNRILCYVRESNLPAQQFFRSLQFLAIRKDLRVYSGEPAYVFRHLYSSPVKLTTANRMSDAR